jgi:hypothetical protein
VIFKWWENRSIVGKSSNGRKIVIYLLSNHSVLSGDSLSQRSQYKTGKDFKRMDLRCIYRFLMIIKLLNDIVSAIQSSDLAKR